jgi:hypothetical protein
MSREREEHGTVPPLPRNEMDGSTEQLAPLFDRERAEEMRRRWTDIQAGFVDDPGRAVHEADELVAQVMNDLAQGFARERTQIEAQTQAGGDQPASTEALRVALRRYRSFFERLLSL